MHKVGSAKRKFAMLRMGQRERERERESERERKQIVF